MIIFAEHYNLSVDLYFIFIYNQEINNLGFNLPTQYYKF